ncbi:MAG: polysaccharide biosynthesis tyrosine autokinase [Chlamydiae bacterium]|nr:polysaccharide biosynthesis tyrosine autokinase [Chlamydiota bacterium]MBI3276186.1 polysaccharide biosynthesis tyrosine autokinase [Chlamydiota bacterium]
MPSHSDRVIPGSFSFKNEIAQTSKHLSDYLRIFWKRKWLVSFVIVAVLSIVAIKIYSAKPLYEANCKILIEKEQKRVMPVDEVYQVNWEGVYLSTQYKIMTSKKFATLVYDKLHLKDMMSIDAFILSYRIEPVRDTSMSSIIVKDTDPERASLIANTIASVFIEQNLERKLEAVRYAVKWLSGKLKGMQNKINKAEKNLASYVKENNIISLPKTDLSEDQSVSFSYYSKEKVNLEEELSKLEKRYKEKHPKIIRVKQELAAISEKLNQEIVQITDLRQKQIQYRVLKREVDVNQELFNTLLNRIKETNLLEGLKTNNISIVDPAEPPSSPAWPIKTRIFLKAFFLSLLLSSGLVSLLEYFDNTFKNDEDVEKTCGFPVLGHIPLASVIKKRMNSRDVALASFYFPNSNFAESYRYVRTAISLSAVDKQYPVLLVTSTYPKEGKTTEAMNLGITMASTGEKVLLIDADMRRPSFQHVIPYKVPKTGLSSYLTGNSAPESVIFETEIPNLSILHCGTVPPNPSEVLGSQKMRSLIEWARTRFQRIIIDSPPVMAVADALVLSSMVDGVIYTIKANRTSKKPATTCLQRLVESHAKVLGVILNQITPKGSGYYYQYNYKYYYNYRDANQSKNARNKSFQNEELVSLQGK